MKNEISIIINWSGTYKFDQAIELEKQGLYLAFGRNKFGAAPAEKKLLYCGISERNIGSRIKEHSNDGYNHNSNEWWIGRQIYPRKRNRSWLELAEWIIVYFTGTHHNKKKTQYPPSQETYLTNEWFFPDTITRRKRNLGVMHWISDVLCWPPGKRLVKEGNLIVWEH